MHNSFPKYFFISEKFCNFAYGSLYWIVMRNNSLAESWFINDFHRKNSMAAQREVQQMSLHPCSREQKLAQIQRIKQHSTTTKESANLERSKKL